MTSACIAHASTSSWANGSEPKHDSKGMPMSRGHKAAIAAAPTIGLAVWPVVISTIVGGPIGLLISSGISLAVAGTASAITYAVTEDDPGS